MELHDIINIASILVLAAGLIVTNMTLLRTNERLRATNNTLDRVTARLANTTHLAHALTYPSGSTTITSNLSKEEVDKAVQSIIASTPAFGPGSKTWGGGRP